MFPAEQSIAALHAAANDIGLTDDGSVRLRITGEVALADDELNSSLRGMEYAGIITFVMVGVVLYFAMRTGGLILNVLVCLTMGLILTAAFATAVGRPPEPDIHRLCGTVHRFGGRLCHSLFAAVS